ncbi:MAG: glycosyltransferase [Chloroflexi bacterium]|nr:glycosyltransferase [Chloroflexota bacterium]
MRICFLSSAYPRYTGDGIASFVRSLAVALVQIGHEVVVVAPHDPAVSATDQAGVQVHRFRYPPYSDRYLAGHGRAFEGDVRLRRWTPLLMPGFILSGVAQALMLHRRLSFDLFHTHWALPGSLMGAAVSSLTGRPFVASLHGSSAYFAAANPLYTAVARQALGRARYVIACSPNLHEKALYLGAAPSRAVIIPYGVDATRYMNGDGPGMRARLGLPAEAPLIGALGRLAYKKGFAHLIAAMPQVLAACPDARCVIGGDGDLRDELQEQIRALGLEERVFMVGNIPWVDTPDFYAMCDVVAVPSVVDASGNTDGLPNVLLEAMASRRAVVASRVAGIPLAIEDGISGVLVPPAEQGELAQALIRLLNDSAARRRLGEAAGQRMAEAFTWQEIASRHLELYERAVREGKQRT